MPIKKLSGRQDVIVATADFAFSDVADGAYSAAVDLPGGAIVLGGGLFISTVFNSATTDQFSIGDKEGSAAAANATYAALSADVTAPTNIPLVPTGKKYTTPSTVGVFWDGVGAVPTAGAGRLTVMYAVDGRASFSQG
jgi:hypothetical protein